MKYLDEEMGKKLPVELAKSLKEELIKTWLQGSIVEINDEAVKAQTTAVQRLPTAINWFESANRYDYGGVYNDFRDDMASAIKDIFEGTDSSQKIIERAVKAKEKLGEIFSTLQIQNRYRLVAENAVNKARNFAQALAYEELGITRYEISAILDQKTSIVCRTLNGKVFETKTAVKYVNEVLSTDPNKVVSKFPWPDPKDFPQTEDDLRKITPAEINKLYNKMSVKLPPYHAFCRTTVIIQTTKFKQATSISEAETFAKDWGLANKVSYEDIPLYVANETNETLFDLKDKYGVTYDEIRTQSIREKKLINGIEEDDIPIMRSNDKRLTINSEMFRLLRTDSPDKINTILQRQNKNNFMNSENLSELISHEFGHKLTANAIKLEQKKQGRKNIIPDKFITSKYSATTDGEKLAEIFVLINKGNKLDKDFINEFNKYSEVRITQ